MGYASRLTDNTATTMEHIFKCLHDFKTLTNSDSDFPIEVFKGYEELHQNYSELKHLLEYDADNVSEIQTLLKCIEQSEDRLNDHLSVIREFLEFYSFSNELDGLLKINRIT